MAQYVLGQFLSLLCGVLCEHVYAGIYSMRCVVEDVRVRAQRVHVGGAGESGGMSKIHVVHISHAPQKRDMISTVITQDIFTC